MVMTAMAMEAREAPEAIRRFLTANHNQLQALGRSLRDAPPPVILTCARGSSDHAAHYLKYAAEILAGVPCASIGASVASVYGAPLKAKGALSVTISQSGKSPDIVALQNALAAAGARTVALVNAPDTPVGLAAQVFLPLQAGPEKSVAATKSCLVSCVAGAAIVAHWLNDQDLLHAIDALPHQLDTALNSDWEAFSALAAESDSFYVIGRGPSFPIAAEMALKLKETCAIHAEAYSAAEVMHGPLELVAEGFPILALAQADASEATTRAAADRLTTLGARVLLAGRGCLPVPPVLHPLLEPIVMLQTAYLAIEDAARRRGRDPDTPRHLQKVTQTV